MAEVAVKDEVRADKEAKDKTAEDARAAQKAAAADAKREADERANTKSHLNEILLLRGLARATSPHGAENLAGALDGLANAIASGRKLNENALVEVALALKNPNGDWAAMVRSIESVVRPTLVSDRSVTGILAAVERREITVDQGQQLLNEGQKPAPPKTDQSSSPLPATPHTTAETDAEYRKWLASQPKKTSE
jgi:hypothetical protein